MRFLPLAALLLLAACGQQVAPSSEAAPDSATGPATTAVSSPVSATTSEVSATPSASAAISRTVSPSPTSSTDRPAGLRGMLLTADEVPTMRGSSGWRMVRTAREGDQPFGHCQLTPLTTIGATSALVRTFEGEGSAQVSAAQIVASFADPKSAWRSFEVLKSWRDKCASRLGSGGTVSELASVTAAPATGHRYLVGMTTSSTAKEFEGIGLVRRGEYVSIVLFGSHGSSHSYPARHEPETRAVPAVAQLLG